MANIEVVNGLRDYLFPFDSQKGQSLASGKTLRNKGRQRGVFHEVKYHSLFIMEYLHPQQISRDVLSPQPGQNYPTHHVGSVG